MGESEKSPKKGDEETLNKKKDEDEKTATCNTCLGILIVKSDGKNPSCYGMQGQKGEGIPASHFYVDLMRNVLDEQMSVLLIFKMMLQNCTLHPRIEWKNQTHIVMCQFIAGTMILFSNLNFKIT